mmetsp:Transcript_18284/g.39523  ORF Transcript_18284/g.39523 Transcript_18284/m.39523 type:complete len:182 (+) Transcript_18284:142-687(+)|eukprot:CAMPEP_0172313142 /NCGR_PEP_ID=MMETSP1058-20130122/19538_1 /TAXON_ID=83371 /ORGANISM="Detonula confervacea, Strain CCMP 353" /LENGTH=181 /DNA_ID=CAMNT_0013026747 /DNA_START=113 /DNA_END=658 /DNA_ORIENTATION=+
MVSEVLVDKEVADAEGITGQEVRARPSTTASVKKEADSNQNNEDASAAAAIVSPNRKRKADTTLQVLVEGESVIAQVDPISPTDPLVQFKIKTMPSSISDIIRLMDTLEPDRTYYVRQKDGRGECSKMRGKLRKYAKANEDKLGVAHWVETRNWKPPGNEALSALMILIRGMIDKSWPLKD